VEKEQIDEFMDLQEEALRRLRAGADRPGYVREVQALVLPSFDDSRAYELMLGNETANSPLVVRTTWRKLADLEKFRNPVVRLGHGVGVRLQPTIEEVDVNLATGLVSKLLSRASALAVPPHIRNSPVGVNGTSYELAFGRTFVQARFKWWCDAPSGWAQLAALSREIQMIVESAIVSR